MGSRKGVTNWQPQLPPPWMWSVPLPLHSLPHHSLSLSLSVKTKCDSSFVIPQDSWNNLFGFDFPQWFHMPIFLALTEEEQNRGLGCFLFFGKQLFSFFAIYKMWQEQKTFPGMKRSSVLLGFQNWITSFPQWMLHWLPGWRTSAYPSGLEGSPLNDFWILFKNHRRRAV